MIGTPRSLARLEVVAGEDAEAAGVLRQRRGDAELGREVGDRRRDGVVLAGGRAAALVPAVAREVVAAGRRRPPATRRTKSAVRRERGEPLRAERAEQPHRVAADLVPQRGVEAAEQVAGSRCARTSAGCRPARPAGASGSGRTVRTVNRRIAFTGGTIPCGRTGVAGAPR